MQGDLSDLIRRVEEAKGPDHSLDAHILCALNGRTMHEESDPANGIFAFWDGEPWKSTCHNCTRWDEITGSLDAALENLEYELPGIEWECNTARHRKGYAAKIWYSDVHRADAPTAPLAVTLALLRALQSQRERKISASGRAKGGHARAASLTPERRKEIASNAAAKRWERGF